MLRGSLDPSLRLKSGSARDDNRTRPSPKSL
jgi:hypothetical protein